MVASGRFNSTNGPVAEVSDRGTDLLDQLARRRLLLGLIWMPDQCFPVIPCVRGIIDRVDLPTDARYIGIGRRR